ncbi:MAG: efflux RND transporter periplasmic adaptor subunit [Parvibaculaceae bacterium]
MFDRVRMNKSFLLPLALLSALILSACGEDDAAESTNGAGEMEAVSVFSARVNREDLIKPVTGSGTIAAHKTTDVGPLVDGIIEKVFVRVGDRVTEGDPLFKTRDVEFRLRVRELENQHRLAEADARNTKRELDRIQELFEKGVASVGQLDNVRTKYEIADAQLGVALARLDSARQNLKDATVTAPFDGVVTRQDIYEGKFMATRMGGGGMGGPSGVVQIMKIDIVGAIINVPESNVGQIGVGTPARIYVDGIDGVYDSEIHIFNDFVDPKTRSAEVRVGIANDDYAIKPGMFTRAEFFPPPRDVLTLDRRAVMGIEGNQYVFVADASGRARQLPVRVSQIDAARVEVLEGLQEGAEVLTGPMVPSLVAGMPVVIEERMDDLSPSSALSTPLSTAEAR